MASRQIKNIAKEKCVANKEEMSSNSKILVTTSKPRLDYFDSSNKSLSKEKSDELLDSIDQVK